MTDDGRRRDERHTMDVGACLFYKLRRSFRLRHLDEMAQQSSTSSDNNNAIKPGERCLPETPVGYPATSSHGKDIKAEDKQKSVTDNPNSSLCMPLSASEDLQQDTFARSPRRAGRGFNNYDKLPKRVVPSGVSASADPSPNWPAPPPPPADN